MSQISPRFGVGTVAMDVHLSERFKCGKFRVVSIVGFRSLGRRGQDSVALGRRKFTELRRGP